MCVFVTRLDTVALSVFMRSDLENLRNNSMSMRSRFRSFIIVCGNHYFLLFLEDLNSWICRYHKMYTLTKQGNV